ncbi:hypothetical protein P4483_27150 [Bacillus thuringiensis]|nr:hypothetical protein [Bacillus thuringiensis]
MNILVNNPITRKPISFLSHDELKNISVNERGLLDVYNDEMDKSSEGFVEIDNMVKVIFFQGLEDAVENLRKEIDIKVKSIFEDGDFLCDLKLNVSFNEIAFKNYQSVSVMNLLIKKINEIEDLVLDEKKKELKHIIKDYFTVRVILFMDNGQVINHPNVQVW